MDEACDYIKVREAIVQILNSNPEAYHQLLHKLSFGSDYQPCLVAQKVQETCLQWLHTAVQTASQVIEQEMVQHYMSVLPLKPKNWVMCHQPTTLEEAMVLMEAYAGAYLIPMAWKTQTELKQNTEVPVIYLQILAWGLVIEEKGNGFSTQFKIIT